MCIFEKQYTPVEIDFRVIASGSKQRRVRRSQRLSRKARVTLSAEAFICFFKLSLLENDDLGNSER